MAYFLTEMLIIVAILMLLNVLNALCRKERFETIRKTFVVERHLQRAYEAILYT